MLKKLSNYNLGILLFGSSNLFAHADTPHIHTYEILAIGLIIMGLIFTASKLRKITYKNRSTK